MNMRIFVTGGTFDKEYNEMNGSLFFKDTHVPEMLELGRCRVDVSIRTLMMIDSLDMTEPDRNVILENCRRTEEDRIVITHGTDTMVETATLLALQRHFQSLPTTMCEVGEVVPSLNPHDESNDPMRFETPQWQKYTKQYPKLRQRNSWCFFPPA